MYRVKKNALHHLKTGHCSSWCCEKHLTFSQHSVTHAFMTLKTNSKPFPKVHNSTSVSKGCSFSCFGRSVFIARDAKEENRSYIHQHQQRWIARWATRADVSRKCAVRGWSIKTFLDKLAATVLWERFSRWRKTDQIITGCTESVSTQWRSLKPPTHQVVRAVSEVS